ncbi:MAG: ElyC/SanA/YdcF family protein [Eubacteriales bacterium]|nr:ElyC/SanA/YdcF family protein [Eubacteriales bacterium]
MKKPKKKAVRLFKVVLLLLFAVITLPNVIVALIGGSSFRSKSRLTAADGYQVIVVLGAGITQKKTPTPILQERLDTGIELYRAGVAPKLLMSGDHQDLYYNEVAVMKQYALEQGVPEEDIFLDHAGLSTYDSMYRAKEIFGAQKLIVVTQAYHLYRACMIGRLLGIEAVGVTADRQVIAGWLQREVRELAARPKDLWKALTKPPSEHLGETISLEQSGVVTDDRE